VQIVKLRQGAMTDQHGGDEEAAADMTLIEELAGGLRLHRWPGDPGTIVELGDMEVTRLLAHRPGGYTFETTERGKRHIEAVFSTAWDARRVFIMELCESYRFIRGMPPMVMKRLAAGCQLEDGPTGHRLSWPGGEATFHDRSTAMTFSWAIGAGRDTILASYQHVNGLPLFDLGIPADEWNLHQRRRPSAKVMEPEVETPPPDDEDPAERLAIDAALADLRWQRRPPSGADVLSVADKYQGRAIAYRQAQFVYESTSPSGYRTAKATFSTAAAARRYMLIELGEVFRVRTGMPKLRSDRLAPHCSIEEEPTSLELIWPDGRASFPLGDKGYQQLLTYSVAVTAELAEVTASYGHPSGEPLFDLGQHPRPPGPP
jgi:hypothetical protein